MNAVKQKPAIVQTSVGWVAQSLLGAGRRRSARQIGRRGWPDRQVSRSGEWLELKQLTG